MWLFPLSAVQGSSSQQKAELSDCEQRAQGIEFLFRVGVQLQLSLSAILTAATYFHRFYVRVPISDYPYTCIASASIFVASKSEECGRRLKDVAMVCMSKANTVPVTFLEEDISAEVEKWQSAILRTEELLLETLGFDFVASHPHAVLADIFAVSLAPALGDYQEMMEDIAWSIATDSYRTPVCVLYNPAVIAAVCLAIAIAMIEYDDDKCLERLFDTPLYERQLEPGHTASEAMFVKYFESYQPSRSEIKAAFAILLQFYRSQWAPSMAVTPGQYHFLTPIATISQPKDASLGIKLYGRE